MTEEYIILYCKIVYFNDSVVTVVYEKNNFDPFYEN